MVLVCCGGGEEEEEEESIRESRILMDLFFCCFFGCSHIVTPPASELSNKMLRKSKYNLNLISHEAAMDLIQFVLDAGVALEEVYVDTVGKKETYQAKLQERFPALSITVDTKADSKYPVVSAASICAKVTRDALLRDWAFEEQGINPTTNFGSGYPGDPTTKKWLKGNMDPVFGFPSLIRFSWKTTTTSLEDQGALTVWYGDEEEEEQRKEKKLPPVQFVYRQGKRARYFSDREMDVANDF